jgi:hypothetical protein
MKSKKSKVHHDTGRLTLFFPENPIFVERIRQDADKLGMSVSMLLKLVVMYGYNRAVAGLLEVVRQDEEAAGKKKR